MGHSRAAFPAGGGPAQECRCPRFPSPAQLPKDRQKDGALECPPGGPRRWGAGGDRAFRRRDAGMKARAAAATRPPRERGGKDLESQMIELRRMLHLVE